MESASDIGRPLYSTDKDMQDLPLDLQEYIEPEDVFDVNPKAEPSSPENGKNLDVETDIDILTVDPVSASKALPFAIKPCFS